MNCCICGKKIEGHGHNPWPYIKDKSVKCCDNCNNKVIETRLELSKKENANANHSSKDIGNCMF